MARSLGFGLIAQPLILGSSVTGALAPDNKIYDVELGCLAIEVGEVLNSLKNILVDYRCH